MIVEASKLSKVSDIKKANPLKADENETAEAYEKRIAELIRRDVNSAIARQSPDVVADLTAGSLKSLHDFFTGNGANKDFFTKLQEIMPKN
jgi:hypothetical protein